MMNPKEENANSPEKDGLHMLTYTSSVSGLSHIMHNFFTECLFSTLNTFLQKYLYVSNYKALHRSLMR